MRNYPIGVHILALALTGGAVAPTHADGPAPGTVTGHGTIDLKRQAELLRVQVDVLAKGKSLKEALAKLRERRLAAQKNLELLGMPASSIEFGEPAIVEEKNERQRQMAMRMMMRQMRNQGNKPAQKPKEAPPVVVGCTLKAEFRLKAAEPEEFLIAANSLEERMKAADLGGLKDLKQASPQDEELAQEEAAEMMGMADGNEPKRGEPVFLYVSKISDEDQEKALAQAFKKAKTEAAQLARAAGHALGALRHLEEQASPTSGLDDSDGMSRFNIYRMRQFYAQAQADGESEELPRGEAVGAKPKKVTYRIVVTASFELKKLTDK